MRIKSMIAMLGLVTFTLMFWGGSEVSAQKIKISPNDAAYAKYQALSTAKKLHSNLPCTVSPTPDEAAAYRAPKAKRRYTIGFMEPTLAGHYYQAGSSGAFKAAKEAGVKLEFVSAGTGYASPEQQLKQAERLLLKGVDAVAVIPTDIQGGVAITNLFLREKIPVVIVATESSSPDAYMVMQDDYQMGRDSADLLVKETGPNAGKGIVIAGPANATWSAKRAAGFADRVKEKYPGVKIAVSATQNVDPAQGLKSFENAVQAHPDIKWVYSVFNLLLDPDSLPARYKDVAFVTNGLDPASIQDLKEGQYSTIIGITPTPMGYQGVGHAVAILNGDQNVPALVCIPLTRYTAKDMPPNKTAVTLELIQKGFEVSAQK